MTSYPLRSTTTTDLVICSQSSACKGTVKGNSLRSRKLWILNPFRRTNCRALFTRFKLQNHNRYSLVMLDLHLIFIYTVCSLYRFYFYMQFDVFRLLFIFFTLYSFIYVFRHILKIESVIICFKAST